MHRTASALWLLRQAVQFVARWHFETELALENDHYHREVLREREACRRVAAADQDEAEAARNAQIEVEAARNAQITGRTVLQPVGTTIQALALVNFRATLRNMVIVHGRAAEINDACAAAGLPTRVWTDAEILRVDYTEACRIARALEALWSRARS